MNTYWKVIMKPGVFVSRTTLAKVQKYMDKVPDGRIALRYKQASIGTTVKFVDLFFWREVGNVDGIATEQFWEDADIDLQVIKEEKEEYFYTPAQRAISL